ncbi:response regulator [Leptolyngbya sp. FACHB-321]|uniref:response regulator n=1 Tax=Leptolyngbya sp. FACHB-321 TaxID=2692807 RepID=UPI0016863840|nr:response regulator [Leptolyngbya sp. FACHB-321]MBD2036438.1 response regulator [Leptolyngbya sp. FACHB-321]
MSLRSKGAIVTAIPVICLVTSLTTFALLQRHLDQAEQWVKHTQEVRLNAEQALRRLVEAETGVRGYDLTHKEEYLQPYTQAQFLIPGTLADLAQLVSDNPKQKDRLKQIQVLVEQQLVLMQNDLELIQAAKGKARNVAKLTPLLDQRKAGMNVIRQRVDEFTQVEDQLLRERSQRLQNKRSITIAVLWVASLIGVAGGFAAHSLYSVGIVRRIRQLQDNAHKMAQGEPLTALILGQDEVSQLDQVLHTTAEKIAERQAQLHEANVLLAAAARKEKALIDNSRDVICSINAEGKFVDLSPACLLLWGYSAEELVGRPYLDFVVPEDVQKTIAVAIDVMAGHVVSGFENRYQRKDGSWIDLLWSASWSDSEQLMFCVARDMTERKEVERLKNDFISTVNHELRTPLTSLRGFTELLLHKQSSPEKQRQYLTIISNETIRLTNLITNFLDIQRIESGQQTYYFEPVDLASLLHESISLFAPNHHEHAFNVVVPDLLSPVKADADCIRQVLANLMSNAIKYSPAGGTITISAHEEETAIRVCVADQGLGMTPEARAKLFTKFYRVDSTATRKIGGTGLGLTLVKSIVEAHNGNITVESEPEKGSTFSFTLPKVLEPVPLVFQEPVFATTIDVLLVEDHENFAKLLQDQFESAGFNVVSTAFAEQALQLLEQRSPRLIVLDIHLAGKLDGWDFLIALRSRSNPKLLSTPVLIITLSSEPNIRGLAFRGADYLPKSVVAERLLQTVEYHLPQLAGKTVLVADDDAAFRQQVIEIIKLEKDVRCLEAVNGREALECIHQQMPDLLILDLLMPETDGFEVLKQLRMNKNAFDLPVIVVTGATLAAEEKKYLKNRMGILVNKQKATLEALTQLVEQTLGSLR